MKNLDILFVDDFSTDGTLELIKKRQKNNPHIFLLVRKNEKGVGSANRKGLKYAFRHNYDLAITMDADLTHSPSYFKKLIKKFPITT